MLALAACGSGEPRVRTNGSVAGEYVLAERQGERLPHTMVVRDGHGRSCDVTVIRSVLTLHADGTWLEQGEGTSRCPGESAPRRYAINDAGNYHLRGPAGDTVVLAETADGQPEQTATLVRDELRIVTPRPPPAEPLRFRYVRQRSRE